MATTFTANQLYSYMNSRISFRTYNVNDTGTLTGVLRSICDATAAALESDIAHYFVGVKSGLNTLQSYASDTFFVIEKDNGVRVAYSVEWVNGEFTVITKANQVYVELRNVTVEDVTAFLQECKVNQHLDARVVGSLPRTVVV